MMEYLDDEQATFFKWCDEIVREYISQEGMTLRQWHPRKNRDGEYELIFELTQPGGVPFRQVVAIPEQFHQLLEREYFICHPDDEDEF